MAFPNNNPKDFTREIYNQEIGNSRFLDEHESCCNRSFCWWSPPKDYITVEFCKETNLHGLKYLGQEKRHIVERIFWLLAFVFGIFAAAWLISDVWRKYKTNPVILAFDPNDMSISEIPFPAITICNVNKVQNSFAMNIQRNLRSADQKVRQNAQTDYYLMRSVCTSKPSFANRIKEGKRKAFDHSQVRPPENDSSNYIADFLYRASQPCTEMLQRCIWGDQELPCDEIFHPIITELGICCTFNMMPMSLLMKFPDIYQAKTSTMNNSDFLGSIKKNIKLRAAEIRAWQEADPRQGNFFNSKGDLPRRQMQAGQSHALSLLLFPDVDNYFCTATDSNGFRVAAHTSFSHPHVLDLGMAVPPGTDVYVDVNAEVTTAEDIITQFDVVDRQCYVEHERSLKYFKYYTQTNCIDECIADLNKSNCSCAWYYQPMDKETKVCEPDPDTVRCTRAVTQEVTQQGVADICDHCLPLCTTVEYHLESSLSGLQAFNDLWDFSAAEYNNSKPIWFNKSVTVLNLFYREQSTVPKIRKELYGSTDLFANTGGLLGLCLGFSGLSAIEIIYFCTLRIWFKRRRFKRNVKKIVMKFVRAFKRFGGNLNPQSSAGNEITLQKNSIPIIDMNQKDYLTSTLMWQKLGKPLAIGGIGARISD